MWLVKKKQSPFFYARWPHPDGTSPDVSRTTGERSERTAEARGRILEAEFREEWDRSRKGGLITAKDLIAEYWDTEGRNLKAAMTHAWPHLKRIATFLGDRLYCDVTVADVARFADWMASRPMYALDEIEAAAVKKRVPVEDLQGLRKFSDSSINRAMSLWRRMHNVAGKKRGYPVKVIDWSLVRRDEPEPENRCVEEEQIARLFEQLPRRGQEIASFALLTGVRKRQVLDLPWTRVNFDAATVQVYRKHRKRRVLYTVMLTKEAVNLLRKRREVTPADVPLVFDTKNFRHDWEKAIDGAGLKGVRFHDLRHTFATMIARKFPILVVKELLSHASITTTMRYAHVSSEDKRAALEAAPTLPMLRSEVSTETDDGAS